MIMYKVKRLKEKYRVGLVGCGVIAQTHLSTLKKINDLKVIAICDIDEEKAYRTSKRWKIGSYYTDFLKMLSDEDIDIMSILSPPSSHAPLAIEAIKHRVNVLIEKPLTMRAEDAKSIIDALRGKGVKMSVVYHWLFSKAMQESLSLIRGGTIGEVLNVNVEVVAAPKEDPMTSNPDHWSHTLLGGRFGEMLSHPVYVLQSILGDELQIRDVFVSRRGNLPWMSNDELHVTLQGAKGFGSLYVSFNAPRESTRVYIYGKKKILNVDLTRQMVLQQGLRTRSKFSIGKDSLSEASNLFFFTMKNALERSFRKRGDITNIYTMFLESIKGDTEMLVTPEMAYNTVLIVEEICKVVDESRSVA